MPRISVLMPVYNGMPYITEAVESVLAQGEQDWELLISDNCSTDSTRAYLSTLQDPRIHIHLQPENLGIFGNLNFLLAQSQASIAKILCADDKLLPSALAQIAAFMEARPWCAVSRCLSSGDLERFKPDQRAGLEGALPVCLHPAAATLVFATFGNLVGNLSKAACRPQQVIEAGGFDQNIPYAGDYEGWMRVSARFGIALQNEELIFERQHATQNSVLLNQKNELFPQINKLLVQLSSRVAESDRAVLQRHWTIHFLAPRLSRAYRQLLAGQFGLAQSVLRDLPLGISAASVIAGYILWKFNHSAASATTRKLFARINDVNGTSP